VMRAYLFFARAYLPFSLPHLAPNNVDGVYGGTTVVAKQWWQQLRNTGSTASAAGGGNSGGGRVAWGGDKAQHYYFFAPSNLKGRGEIKLAMVGISLEGNEGHNRL